MMHIFNLHKQFGKKILFSGLSLTLPSTGIILISGSSGSGKSTFLKCLNGLTTYEGMIEVDGIDLRRLTGKQRLDFRQRFIGAVYQNIGLLEDTTIEETLIISARLKKLEDTDYQASLTLLNTFLPNIQKHHPVKKLSFGQRQRLAMIRAMMGKPKILLFDEPTTGLDKAQRKVIKQLIELASQTSLVFLISHDQDIQTINHLYHLKFPYQGTFKPSPPASPKKYPEIKKRVHLPLRWMIGFQWKKINQESGRMMNSVLQSIIFILLTSLLSLASVIGLEFKNYASQLIGGQYQFIQSQAQENLTVYSATESHLQSFFLNKEPLIKSYYYESSFFEQLKPFQHFSLEKDGFEYILKDFNLGLLNDFQYLPFLQNHQLNSLNLENHQVVLGLQPVHIRLISKILGVFPTIETINQRLHLSSLLIFVHTDQPVWKYQDVFTLEIKAVIETEAPLVFHSNPLFSTHVFESLMQFPTKDVAEEYFEEPWRVGKTISTLSLKTETFIHDYFTSPMFDRFHLQRIDKNRLNWYVMHYAVHSLQKPPLNLQQRNRHYATQAGYHYYPEQNLSGFAQLITLAKDSTSLSMYQLELNRHEDVIDKLAVVANPLMARGHLLLPDLKNVKFEPTLTPLKTDEIIISHALAKTLDVSTNDRLYLSTESFLKVNQAVTMVPVTIKAIDHDLSHHRIQHNAFWFDFLLVNFFQYPSFVLHPLGWSIYDSIPINANAWIVFQPYLKMRQQIEQWTLYLYLGIGGIFWFFAVPVIIAFYSHFLKHLRQSKMIYQTLVIQGAGYREILQFGTIKVSLMIAELFFMISSGFLSVDLTIHWQLKQRFLSESSYTIPLIEWSIIGMVIFAIWAILQDQLRKTLKMIITIH
jgi:ABC-type lipoprotein export system ATPase subunit